MTHSSFSDFLTEHLGTVALVIYINVEFSVEFP